VQQAGPLQLAEADRQASGILQDRVDLPGHIRLTAGGRYASVGDSIITGTKGVWLPQYAATYQPAGNLTLYGNYSVLLSLGPQAPFWAIDSSVYLAPFFTRQAEAGAKYEPSQRVLLTAAFYRMRAPFFYPKLISVSDAFCALLPGQTGLCFESEGHETHDGFEFGAQGRVNPWVRLSTSFAAISAEADRSGTPSFDGKQVINVPKVKVATFADIAVPRVGRLRLGEFHLLPGWGYSGRKEATRDDAVSVAGYNLFNLGARYSPGAGPGGDEGRVTFRLYADNILDKRYWKDTGASYGDTFIHLGAPTTVRLSATYRFGK
jgi:iron complex outermembrane receptor protein